MTDLDEAVRRARIEMEARRRTRERLLKPPDDLQAAQDAAIFSSGIGHRT